MTLFAADPVYRRFLAQHAGLWAEVGVFDDVRLLASLRLARRKAGLPADRWTPPDLSYRVRVLGSTKCQSRPKPCRDARPAK
jgi:hypothetical protein